MFDVYEITNSLPHIQISKDFTWFIVLLISQKDYEHYIAGEFDSKDFLSEKKHIVWYGCVGRAVLIGNM